MRKFYEAQASLRPMRDHVRIVREASGEKVRFVVCMRSHAEARRAGDRPLTIHAECFLSTHRPSIPT